MIVKWRNCFLSKVFNFSQKLQFAFFPPLWRIMTYLATHVQEINIGNPCKGVKHIKPIFHPDSNQLLNIYVLSMCTVTITESASRTTREVSLTCVHGHLSMSRNAGVSYAGYCM